LSVLGIVRIELIRGNPYDGLASAFGLRLVHSHLGAVKSQSRRADLDFFALFLLLRELFFFNLFGLFFNHLLQRAVLAVVDLFRSFDTVRVLRSFYYALNIDFLVQLLVGLLSLRGRDVFGRGPGIYLLFANG